MQPTRAAILIIHGIGQQPRYETLLKFCAGFYRHLRARGFDPRVCLVPVSELPPGVNRGLRVRLASQHGSFITDIFEYYWGPFIQAKMTPLSIIRWFLARTFPRPEQLAVFPHAKALWDGFILTIYLLFAVALLIFSVAVVLGGEGANGTFPANILMFQSLAEIAHALNWVALISPTFWVWFLVLAYALWQVLSRCVGILGILLRRPPELLSIEDDCEDPDGPAHLDTDRAKTLLGNLFWLLLWLVIYEGASLQMSAFSMLYQKRLALMVVALWAFRELLKTFFINFIGDIPAYLSRNEYAPSYPARRKIIDTGSDLLSGLIGLGRKDASDITIKAIPEPPGQYEEVDRNPCRYERVIVAGHSLGSVIGLDILRQTFLRASRDACWETITHFITFGSPLRKISYLTLQEEGDPQRLRLDSFTRTLTPVFRKGAPNEMVWWNFVLPTDPVADYLNNAAAYSGIPKDITIPRILEPVSAHARYWSESVIYEYVCTALSI